MKDKLGSAALALFDLNGYYRTGVRDVAARAGCTLPTLYYHYGSKEQLFKTLVYEEYKLLNERISDQLPQGLPPRDALFFGVMQRALLEGEDRIVFRLAVKTLLGLEGPEDVRSALLAYEKERLAREGKTTLPPERGPAFARLCARVTGEMLRAALLEDSPPSPADIGEELDLLFGEI